MNLRNLAVNVASQLPGTWSVGDKSHAPGVVLRDVREDRDFGVTLWINVADPKGKIEISGTMPKDDNGDTHGKSPNRIGVSRDRDPGAIAREIERRFLPDYRVTFAEAIPDRDSRNEYDARTKESIARFVALGAVTPRDPKGTDLDFPMVNKGDNGYFRRFQVGGGTVHLEIGSVPEDIAEQIVKLILGSKD